MKKNFHPTLHDAVATCACGQTYKITSVLPEVTSDICANCHPFFTGQQKFIDRAGRIEKFQRRFEAKNTAQ